MGTYGDRKNILSLKTWKTDKNCHNSDEKTIYILKIW